jgi:hypothetical protein
MRCVRSLIPCSSLSVLLSFPVPHCLCSSHSLLLVVCSHPCSLLSHSFFREVTPGFFLPARCVVHVTGPQLRGGAQPTPAERAQLAAAYASVLDACAAHGPSSGGSAVRLC